MTWPTVKLSDVAKIDRNGIDPKKMAAGARYLGLEHIESGGNILGAQTVENGELASTKFRFNADHILYGKLRPYLGKIALPDFSGICSTDILPIKPGKHIDRRFLAYFLRLPENVELASSRSTGVNLPRLSPKTLADFDVPLPPLADQRRIATILDKTDGIRRRRGQALEMAEKLLRAAFLEIFGDPATNPNEFIIEEIALHLSKERSGTQSGPFGSALKKHEYVDEGIPVWGVDNVQHDQFVDRAKLFITEDKFDQLDRYSVQPGDILISRAGTVGRMCIAQTNVEKSIISTNLVRVVVNGKTLLPDYFVSLFTYLPHRLGALRANNKENAFTFLNPKTLRSLRIPIPPIELQEQYRLIRRKIDRQVEFSRSQLNGLDELFASLSQRAFRGEL